MEEFNTNVYPFGIALPSPYPELVDTDTFLTTVIATAQNNTVNCKSESSLLKNTIVPITYIIICIIGLAGNGLVLRLLIRQDLRPTVGTPRSVTNILVINLAMADIIFVGAMPFWTAERFLGGNWAFGGVGCKLLSFISLLNLYGSVFFLVAMGIDRYLAIVFAVKIRQFRTTINAKRACLGIWLFACFIASQALIFRMVRENKGCGTFSCSWIFPNQKWTDAYFVIRTGLGFFIPFFVITYCYIFIIISLRRRSENVSVSGVNMTATQHKVTRLICAVISMFVVCWLPNHVITLLWAINGKYEIVIDENKLKVASVVSSCLSYANSSLNPILYAFMKEDVREELIRLVRRCFGLQDLHPSIKTRVGRDERTEFNGEHFENNTRTFEMTTSTPLTPRKRHDDCESNSLLSSIVENDHNLKPAELSVCNQHKIEFYTNQLTVSCNVSVSDKQQMV